MHTSSISLFIKLTAPILLFISLVYLVLGVSFWYSEKKNNRRDARLLGETIVGNLAQLIQLHGLNDHEWLKPYLVSIGSGPSILDVYVCNDEGTVVAGARLSYEEESCSGNFEGQAHDADITTRVSQGGSVLRVMQPIRSINLQQYPVGAVVIEVDLKDKFPVTLWENQRLLLLIMLSLISLGTVIYFFMHFAIVRKLQTLQAAAIQIARGDFFTQVPSLGSDEFDTLADTFNYMTKTLGETVISRNYFLSVIRSVGDILFVLDPAGQVTMVNPAALRTLGYEEEHVSRCHIRDLLADPSDKYFPAVNNDVVTYPDFVGEELELMAEGDERIPVIFSRTTIMNENHEPMGYVCVAQDLRQRKRAEIKIREMNEHLQQVNRTLQETQAQLVQSAKLASLGEMATGITHELNQPLLIITLNAQMASKLLEQDQGAEVAESLSAIIEQVNRASKIINHLKIFGRKSESASMEAADINQIIKDSYLLFTEQFRLLGIQVQCELAADLPLFACNRIQVEQVLTNLLANARDALVESAEKVITVQTRQEGENLIVEIADTGKGITSDIRDQIFDPFFTTKEIGKGTGLGLAISYGIMEQHKGSLEYESEPGKGTIFRMKFPVTKDA